MKPRELVQEATIRVLEGDRQPDEMILQAIFRVVSEEMNLDPENFTTDNVHSIHEALMDTEGDEVERAQVVIDGIRGLRSQAYGVYDTFSGKEIAEANKKERS